MSTVIVTPDTDTSETHVFPPLLLADRSDAVPSAQALVRVVRGSQDLLLDGHTYNKSQAQLIAEGWTVYEDVRETVS